MKLGRVLLFVVLLGSLNACMWGGDKNKPTPAITKDTLAYSYQIIHERAADCGSKPDSGCTVVKIKYPVFNSAKTLNDTVSHGLINIIGANKSDTSLQLLTTNFLKEYDNFKKTEPTAKSFFTLDAYGKVLRQDSSLITIEIGDYQFTGGAHGATYVRYVNWDTKKNVNIKLSDILVDGYESKLTKTAEIIFRKNEELSMTASLKDDYFFKDGIFALNNNFLVTPTGLKFLYNSYEIKPYAAGRTELDIPWMQLKYLLKPNTVITQYIK